MIKIEKLSFRYHKSKVLFNGLDLELAAGSIYGLLGKNGAGKSTLMKTITGLLFPFEGTCTVNHLQPHKREQSFLEQLFFIPEECYLPPLSIVHFLNIYAPFYPSFNRTEFYQYLNEFNIDAKADLDKLSFGQKKKTFIAFGLAANTRLLVMDEPTNGLDIPSKVQFRKIMTNAGKADKIILLSTHQVRDLDDLISSVIIMDNSKILLHTEKEQIAERLFFCKKSELGNETILYEEQTPNGLMAMCINNNQSKSYIDLEILFNATLHQPTLLNTIFNKTL
ncbi:ATP-binding cassette domain-containing protein [Pedobacter sp. UBA5917]|jgi:ABC-2 type transport system ATP-binding protein|uniref:ABC transporter ATP-binding protein n=1 Tax=Pedobacter sp. UBA5917 TaxID=1947061 RepID=UPI0025D14090|nr:ABC transporter ATP-binding protein [Pedobacter sp. UBA5917]